MVAGTHRNAAGTYDEHAAGAEVAVVKIEVVGCGGVEGHSVDRTITSAQVDAVAAAGAEGRSVSSRAICRHTTRPVPGRQPTVIGSAAIPDFFRCGSLLGGEKSDGTAGVFREKVGSEGFVFHE